jgi:hypothetical protein
MTLPKTVDELLRKQIESLIAELGSVEQAIEKAGAGGGRLSSLPPMMKPSLPLSGDAFDVTRTRFVNLLSFIAQNNSRYNGQVQDIRSLEATIRGGNALIGAIKAFKADYEAGMLSSLTEIIEADMVSDYMVQAEQLLGEGVPGQYDYVPAAVLTGAVLEDTLRRLCQRQSPTIDVLKPDGSPKTLDPLIADLQKASVINKAKADQLRSWAKIRNYAAHGEFAEFKRTDVESLINGVKAFIADYL